LRKLEQKAGTGRGRIVHFPGRSHEQAEREAKAMIERGEIAADDMVLGSPREPCGPTWIQELRCTNAEFHAWLDTLPARLSRGAPARA
jgi:hypothetical protein